MTSRSIYFHLKDDAISARKRKFGGSLRKKLIMVSEKDVSQSLSLRVRTTETMSIQSFQLVSLVGDYLKLLAS